MSAWCALCLSPCSLSILSTAFMRSSALSHNHKMRGEKEQYDSLDAWASSSICESLERNASNSAALAFSAAELSLFNCRKFAANFTSFKWSFLVSLLIASRNARDRSTPRSSCSAWRRASSSCPIVNSCAECQFDLRRNGTWTARSPLQARHRLRPFQLQ